MKTLFATLLLGAFALAPAVQGQGTDGNIVGTVLDATGAAVPNANVELANQDTGIKSATKSDSTGSYRFGNVLIGAYTITVTANGFTTSALKDVRVELNKTATANVSLQVGAVSSQVEVTEAVALLDTTTAQVTNSYEKRLAADLTMSANSNGGIYNLALVGAGVASSGGVGVGTGPSVGGQRPRNNNFTVDGVDNNRKDITGPVVYIPNDAVAEFTVLQNQFSSEFGHSSGGQFNAVVKGGTNAFHGSVYEYLRNRNLEAVDQSAARTGILSNPRYDQNRVGGEAGGPMKRNKLFAYGLYEYNPLGQAATPGAAIFTPTSAGFAQLDSISGLSATNLGILKQYAPPAPAQNKTVPVADATGKVTNVGVGVLPIVLPSFQNTYNYVISSDYTISEKDQLRGRYVSNKIVGLDTAAALPIFFTNRPTTSKVASVSEFHNFRPNLYNEIRLAFNRYNDDIVVPDFKYPGLDVFPNVVLRDELNLNIGPNGNAPQGTIQTTYQIVDNISWTKGKHDVKFGVDLRNLKAASTFIQRVRGDYEYTTLDRFLRDVVPDFIAQRNVGGKPYSGDQNAGYFFVNDNYRHTRNLTLNLGLRYEYNGVAKSMKEFDLNKIADVPGVLTFGAPKAAKKNFGPRVGFAYSPGNSGTTSIRGGFGIAYDQVFDNVGTNARPPQATSTLDSPVTNTPGYLKNGGIRPDALPATLSAADARAATSSYLPQNQQIGYALTWNMGFQHSFAKDYTFEARYVGTKGVHLLYQLQINRAAVVTKDFNLPTFFSTPTSAQLAGLTTTYQDILNARNKAGVGNTLAQYGFTSNITAYTPRGNSEYHGLAMELKKRYARNLLFTGAYTWSHNMDDSTAEVNSIVASPRRPQDFNDIRNEWASSALDRRHRFTLTGVYDIPFFSKDKNMFVRNAIGNWSLSGTYTAETGELATPQSGVDANQNGDSAPDRAILNVNGTPGLSSDVTPINKAGQTVAAGSAATVAYVARNPNAQFVRAQVGAYATTGRNILQTPGINNFDVTLSKTIAIKERWKLQLRAETFNTLNHPQYTLGRTNNVRLRSTSGSANWFIPGNALFGQWDQSFSSNPRVVQVTAKLQF